MESLKCQFLRFAEIGFAELARILAVGIPVPAMPFALIAGGEGTKRTFERKGVDVLLRQPAVPGIRSNYDRSELIFCPIKSV
jgi:hypothetical protein